jgi:hypothetical protein
MRNNTVKAIGLFSVGLLVGLLYSIIPKVDDTSNNRQNGGSADAIDTIDAALRSSLLEIVKHNFSPDEAIDHYVIVPNIDSDAPDQEAFYAEITDRIGVLDRGWRDQA